MPGCRAEYAVSWGKEFLSTPSARRATKNLAVRHLLLDNFYPRPPRGGRRRKAMAVPMFIVFLSTPSARRATSGKEGLRWQGCNFYPRPPRGGRPAAGLTITASTKFLSTPSARRATEDSIKIHCDDIGFLSTPSARRATEADDRAEQEQIISIHALREEGDFCSRLATSQIPHFYPRPPRGGRQVSRKPDGWYYLFLSTPSARRATEHMAKPVNKAKISIHALREEGDTLKAGGI